jgi:hypothetical protein
MIKIEVKGNMYSSSTMPTEEYGSWHIDEEHDLYALKEVIDDDFFDIILDIEKINHRKNYFLVYGIYSIGDSFGEHMGKIEYLKLFETFDEAKIFKDDLELLEKYADSNFKRKDFEPQLLDNIKKEYSWDRCFEYFGEKFTLPWGGYFDNLTNYHIKELGFEEN